MQEEPDELPVLSLCLSLCLELSFKRGEDRDQCEKKNRRW